jgi:acyl carrier protein
VRAGAFCSCEIMNTAEFLGRLGETLMLEGAQLTPETELSSLSGWDSMGMVAVVGLIDQELDTTLPRGALQACKTVGDVVDLVKSKLSI